jgi:hypothetical protein
VKTAFERDGAFRVANAIEPRQWQAISLQLPQQNAGTRLRGIPGLEQRIGIGSVPWSLVAALIGDAARPVRAILFNKTPLNNWPLGWHQDRTIAVARRKDVPGFRSWTVKQCIQHVEPPFEMLANMITVRIHLDTVDVENAPLRIVPGSHRLGRIAESDYASALARFGETDCLAEAGDIWIYSTPILHASRAASQPRSRRVVQVDYCAEALPGGLEWAGI